MRINPNSQLGNALAAQQLQSQVNNPLNDSSQNGAVDPLALLSNISPEGQQPDAQMMEMLQAVMKAYQEQQEESEKEQRIKALQEEIQKTETELAQAQESGDEEQVQELGQKLETLKAELAQLLGQDGAQNGAAQGGDQAGAAPPIGGDQAGPPPGGGEQAGPPPGGGEQAGPPPGGGEQAGPPPGGEQAGPPPVDSAQAAPPVNDIAPVPPELAGDDAKMAEYIETKLEGTPLAGQGLGAHFVAAGNQHNVDPLVLASISKHETGHGKLGVGVVKHMGVGAFDNSPNTPRRWDGAINQIYSGARTFANLRRRGGSTADSSIGHQLAAVNQAGWATDRNWHSKVASAYNTYASGASNFVSSTRVATNTPTTPSTTTSSTRTTTS